MTNYEKYKDDIERLGTNSIAFDKSNNKIVKCVDIACKDCAFYESFDACRLNAMKWAVEEYTEPEKEEKENKSMNKRWRAKLLRQYWYVTDYCGISLGYAGSRFDDFHYDTHNYFQTEDEAQKYANVLETERQLKKFADEYNGEIDWGNNNQEKCYLYYSYSGYKVGITNQYWTKQPRIIHFSSEEIAQQAINEIGEDKIKEYLTYEW